MRVQVVYKPRHFSYDLDWLEAFKVYANAELINEPKKLDGDLIVIHHSITGQSPEYPDWLIRELLVRRGKLVIFHTNEFKNLREREDAAKFLEADFIATQLPDGRLYSIPTVSMPHALNPKVFYDRKLDRTVSVGFRGARYKPGIHDARNAVIEAFQGVSGADVLLNKDALLPRDQWAEFLNKCKAMPGAEAGQSGGRIVGPRHLEGIGCGVLQILLKGDYCGVIDETHYLPFTNVKDAMEVVLDEKLRSEITERALTHVLENHTYKHRIDTLMRMF